MWRGEPNRGSPRRNPFRRLGHRALSWVGGIVGALLIFLGLALAGLYSNWFTSWAASNLPFSISGIVLILVGLVILIAA